MLFRCLCFLIFFALVTASYNEEEEEELEGDFLERFKRQAEEANGTDTDDGPPPPDGPRPVHPKMRRCCKKMPRVIPGRMLRGCGFRGGPPPPPGPPPPGDGPPGPPPPGGPPPPPPEGDIDENDGGIPGPPPDDEGGEEEEVTQEPVAGDEAPQKYKGPGGGRGGKKCKGGRGRDKGAWMEQLACTMECAFNKSGMIKDGKVDQDAFKADMEKMKEDKNGDVWKDAIDAALQNCSATVPDAVKQDQKCKSGALEMAICMDNLLFANCPESLWKSDNEKCKACRTSPENCAPAKREKKKKGD